MSDELLNRVTKTKQPTVSGHVKPVVSAASAPDGFNNGMDIEFIDRIFTIQMMISSLLDGHVCAKMSSTQGDIETVTGLLYNIYNDAALFFNEDAH